ncbi:hypothetical protein SeMB42_g00444 [Synchytrium endobioticum]|uniref:C2H2-type domain-containing protein n=1 Tax=Synchytrium endobioticum TaxID=286115 RepID=A0A507DQQ6_9FUNG|nr:hypothetical protein SeMB42_g00444 [Synchytrium endobioticum]
MPSDLKRHRCQYCEKAFKKSGDLKRHERIHTNTRPFECELCGRAFIQKSGLTVHMRTHTGERPHACLDCDRAFSDASSLNRHRKLHDTYGMVIPKSRGGRKPRNMMDEMTEQSYDDSDDDADSDGTAEDIGLETDAIKTEGVTMDANAAARSMIVTTSATSKSDVKSLPQSQRIAFAPYIPQAVPTMLPTYPLYRPSIGTVAPNATASLQSLQSRLRTIARRQNINSLMDISVSTSTDGRQPRPSRPLTQAQSDAMISQKLPQQMRQDLPLSSYSQLPFPAPHPGPMIQQNSYYPYYPYYPVAHSFLPDQAPGYDFSTSGLSRRQSSHMDIDQPGGVFPSRPLLFRTTDDEVLETFKRGAMYAGIIGELSEPEPTRKEYNESVVASETRPTKSPEGSMDSPHSTSSSHFKQSVPLSNEGRKLKATSFEQSIVSTWPGASSMLMSSPSPTSSRSAKGSASPRTPAVERLMSAPFLTTLPQSRRQLVKPPLMINTHSSFYNAYNAADAMFVRTPTPLLSFGQYINLPTPTPTSPSKITRPPDDAEADFGVDWTFGADSS